MSNKSITTIVEEPEDVPIPISRNLRSITGFTDSLGDYRQSNPEIVKQQTFSDVEVTFITAPTNSFSSSVLHESFDNLLHEFLNEDSYTTNQGINSESYEAQNFIIEKKSESLKELDDPKVEVINEEDSFKRLVFHDDTFKAHFETHILKYETSSIIHNKECKVCKYCRVIGDEIFQNHSQEPWPKDVRLFQPYEVEQILLPDNANCLAVQTFLKMCDLEYTVDPRANAEAMSPTGKVPFIKCGAFIVAEMEGIVQFVGNRGISLTQDMSAENKSDMRAYMTLVNNVLGNAELYICWSDNETYQDVTKPRYGSIYPWPLNHIQAWSKRSEEIKKLKVLGWYDKTMEEVYNDVETCCQALTDRLDGHEYFFGSRPTELEALIFGHLYTILTTPLPNATLPNTVKNFPQLINLITRIERKYFQKETKH